MAGEVHRLFASPAPEGPEAGGGGRSDPGYFGPSSVAWRVHGDVTTMLAGGISALLLQMLHPGALAGVWDHSDFRRDMPGRLRRTARFLSGTTYGSRHEADALVARVRAIHDRVHGTLPDGTPYSANDPDLLTWVHVAGTWSFLQSWLRYGDRLSAAERDRYFAETAVIARKLGARQVPASEGEAEAYFRRMRPHLRADARTRIVARALFDAPPPSATLVPLRRLVMDAGIALLPDYAAEMHGLSGRLPGPAVSPAMRMARRVTAWALDA
jgi:uncharacterized protein (DUF2236 family)